MKKNSQIHIFVETDLRESLEKQAIEGGISVSELCRQKLKGNSRLDRIELVLNKMEKSILWDRGLYKSKEVKESIIN